MNNLYGVVNIHDYLTGDNKETHEESLRLILSTFSCKKNLDIEHFIKHNAIDFAKKHQAVTYLVFAKDTGDLLGFFALTIKPLTLKEKCFSKTIRRKLARISEIDIISHTYTLAAYLIAQIGKNETIAEDKRIPGNDLLDLAMEQTRLLQYQAGGLVAFLEAVDHKKLLSFYQSNDFLWFGSRSTRSTLHAPNKLVQFLRIIK